MIVDISTERVQRCTTFLVRFGTCDLRSIHTTGNSYLDTFCTHAHAGLDSHFNRTTVRDTTFDLTADAIGYQARIQFRALNFEDIDLDILTGNLLQLLF
jgi:hypothetical protein